MKNCHCGHSAKDHYVGQLACQKENCKCQIVVPRDVPRIPVKSSNLASIGYDKATTTVVIEYKPTTPTANGAVYFYNNVPAEKWKEVEEGLKDENFSIGSFSAKNFRKLPNYGKVWSVSNETKSQ